MGCGAIFFEAHITSLAARGRQAEQKALYDTMFRDVRTDFLQLMIRHDHEPVNDNADPVRMAFKQEHFAYLEHTVAICREARARRPGIRFHAVLYTPPPPWMKTNGIESADVNERATLKDGMELEFAEFAWAFLAAMAQAGCPVEFLIANEPDWPHEQPGYCLTPESNARLTRMTV